MIKTLYRKMVRKTLKGQITIEASIIVPITILIVASLVYVSLYCHDLVTVRSTALTYIDGEQNGNGGCLVITPLIVKDEDKISTKVSADFGSKSNANFLNKIISRKSKDEIKIQKVMNRELLYAIRAMEDGFGRK